jgi:hypothetical protein
VLAGNHTLIAARDAGWADIAVCWVDVDDDQAARIVAADNRTADLGAYDEEVLAALLGDLTDLDGTGYTEADLAALVGGDQDDGAPPANPSLADRFLVPPFSVLDARSGWWRDRKRRWLSGIDPGAGRGEHLAFNTTKTNYMPSIAAGTSVFDPVLCEVVYRWFSPAGGAVLDPWAGGSVRGLVAALLGRTYVGVELRAEQIAANVAQAATILDLHPADVTPPTWLVGDSRAVLPTLTEPADLVFGCPPYFDLERYGDDPRDLSAMSDADYRAAYRTIITAAADQLRPDRFAVLVVSAARSPKTGFLRDLRGLTVDAAAAAGLALYNEAVLVTPVGSLPIRTAGAFVGSRIMGRTHQDVLVFVKGDRKRATAACGQVDAADIDAALADIDTDDDGQG